MYPGAHLPARGDKPAQLLKRPTLALEQLLPILLPRMAAQPVFAPWLEAMAAFEHSGQQALPPSL